MDVYTVFTLAETIELGIEAMWAGASISIRNMVHPLHGAGWVVVIGTLVSRLFHR